MSDRGATVPPIKAADIDAKDIDLGDSEKLGLGDLSPDGDISFYFDSSVGANGALIVDDEANTRGIFHYEIGSEAVFNEDGDDIDLRVEGSGEANLLFIDAGNDRIGIATNSPSETLDISGTLGIDDNWVLDSQSKQSIDRLRITGVGANDQAELFIQAKGTSDIAKITVTPDNNDTNFSGAVLQSDGTDQFIDSIGEGTANALPLKLKMEGTDVLEITTTPDITLHTDVTLNGSVDFEGTGADTVITLDDTFDLVIEDNANTDILTIAESGQLRADQDGSVSSPFYSFGSDTNTGIRRSGADTLTFTTGGDDEAEITSAGDMNLEGTLTESTTV